MRPLEKLYILPGKWRLLTSYGVDTAFVLLERGGGMKKQDYHRSFTTTVTAEKAYVNITDVAGWWTKSFKGSAKERNDIFEVSFGETKVTFKVIEATPYKRLAWLVDDCYLAWLSDKTEWKGTKVVWDISEENKATKIQMTHLGLVPGVECYKDCEAGWNQYVGESPPKLLTTGEGEAAPVGFSRRAQNPRSLKGPMDKG
jgi:hypothetical protein